MGVMTEPLYTFCGPQEFLPNVLHEKINTGNDVLARVRDFVDEAIESLTPEEKAARELYLHAEIALEDAKEAIVVLQAHAREGHSYRKLCNVYLTFQNST